MPQKVEVQDFSGGVTDYHLNAPPNKLKTCNNLLINQYAGMGKPFTRPGSEIYSASSPQIPAGAKRISTAFYYKNILHLQSETKLYWDNAGTWTEVSGPTGNPAFIGATSSNYFSYTTWNFHTLLTHSGRVRPQKAIINASNEPEIFEAGLPAISASGVTFTPTGVGNNWLYKLVYKQSYTTSGNVTFLDYGTPSASVAVVAGTSVAISILPVLSNGASSNFRTSDIKIEIYRTTHNGTVFYRVGEVTNGTTTFNDAVTDATLVNNITLYTTGGVVGNDRPPKCKVVHVAKDNIAYYGNIEDSSGQILTNRCVQSIAGDIDSVPETFYVDVDDEIVGISSTKSNTILLCRNSAYRLDGTYDELGRGGINADRISDTAGCVSAACVVQALDGVFWLGVDGAYFTDGFKVVRLNGDYDKTYRSWTTDTGLEDPDRTDKFQGKYDKVKNRIWWTVQDSGVDVDTCYVLDLNWGIQEKATFTTVNGTSFAPTAIEFINGNLIRCDKRGYVLIHRDNLYSDLKIDTSTSASNWYGETIQYELQSIAYNFGTSATRKYVTGINVTCESSTNLSLNIESNNDDSLRVKSLKPIRYRGNVTWGDDEIYWGDTELFWNLQGLINEKRRMPANSLRCNYKAIKLSNALVAIVNSDAIGTVSINGVAKTATLDSATYAWPNTAVDYYISFEADGYVNEYLITARTSTTLTFQDLQNTAATAAAQKWVVRGYPKGEVLNLLSYSLIYELSGPTLGVYNTADSGEVGT